MYSSCRQSASRSHLNVATEVLSSEVAKTPISFATCKSRNKPRKLELFLCNLLFQGAIWSKDEQELNLSYIFVIDRDGVCGKMKKHAP